MKIKTLFYFIFSLSILARANVNAEQLTFERGSKARFHVTQTANFEEKSMLDSSWSSEVKAVIDITMLAPDEVEIVIQDLQIDCLNNRPYYKHSVQFSSTAAPQGEIAEAISKLVHTPLRIIIDGNFKIHGSLDQVQSVGALLKHHLDADDLELLCVTKDGFEQFLTHLFHLQRVEFEKGSSYPAAFYPDLNARYEIQKIGPKVIHATFDKKVKAKKGWHNRLSGEAKWDRNNAMVQQRDMTVKVKYDNGIEKVNNFYNLSWNSVPLK